MRAGEGVGEAGTISGTSRATYLFKFMATSAAICLCQLMTGPDTKVMKTPRSDSTLVAMRVESKYCTDFADGGATKKVLSVDIFYLSVKIV